MRALNIYQDSKAIFRKVNKEAQATELLNDDVRFSVQASLTPKPMLSQPLWRF